MKLLVFRKRERLMTQHEVSWFFVTRAGETCGSGAGNYRRSGFEQIRFTRRRKYGNTDSSNHGLFLNQRIFRGLG